jgi:uncharacterized protein (DUF1330 family)
MTVYTIAHLKFTDIDAYRRYQNAFPAVFAKFNGKVVVADEAPVVTSGDVDADKVVVLSFPDTGEAKRFFESAEYREIARDRDKGAKLSAVLVKGFEPK